MLIGIGTDIVEIERVAKMLEEHGDAFLNKIFTPVFVKLRRGGLIIQYLPFGTPSGDNRLACPAVPSHSSKERRLEFIEVCLIS